MTVTTWPVGAITPAGFSAFTSGINISGNWPTFSNWQVLSTDGQDFNASNGVYTVPETGHYSIAATIVHSADTMTSVLQGDTPKVTITNSTANRDLLVGTFSVFDININSTTLRAILSKGTILITGNFDLNAGDRLYFSYTSYFTCDLIINFGSNSEPGNGNTFSITKIS